MEAKTSTNLMMTNTASEEIRRCVAIVITDKDLNIQWVNDGFTLITGYNIGEVMGHRPCILQYDLNGIDINGKIQQCLELKAPFREKFTHHRKNGEEYTCLLCIHPIFNSFHELTNFVGLAIDGDNPEESTVTLLKAQEKYFTSNLKQSDEQKIYSDLQTYFDNEKPYLDKRLSQDMVAESIGTNEKYLSQVINKHTGKNFRHFVNRYRILEFKSLVSSNEMSHLTLFGIAEKCGFKSKSTFYNAVVSHTGHTPKVIALRHNMRTNSNKSTVS